MKKKKLHKINLVKNNGQKNDMIEEKKNKLAHLLDKVEEIEIL